MAAKLLEGKKVADHVRCIVMPATQHIFQQCIDLGYLSTFISAGCAVSTPTCGPCLGGHMGILAAGYMPAAEICWQRRSPASTPPRSASPPLPSRGFWQV